MRSNDVLTLNDGIIKVPFLVKGKLIVPPHIDRDLIEKAFSSADNDTTYAKLMKAQVIREPAIERKTMKYSGDYIYQLMPTVEAEDLIEKDFEMLSRTLYSLSVDDILKYLDTILA